MQKVQFFALDRAVQDRFVNSSHGKEVPAPLLYERPRLNSRAVMLAGAAAFLVLVLLGFAVVGYGSLGHPLARAPLGWLGLYAGVSALAAALGVLAWRLFREDDKLPFLRGNFLYPVGVIEATEPELVVHELVTLKDMNVEGSQIKLTFESGKQFDFTLPNAGAGSAIETVLRQAQARASLPPGAHSQREGILQNPLLDTGYNNPFGPRDSLRPEPRGHAVSTFALFVLGAVACGVGAFFLRKSPERARAVRQSSRARHDDRVPSLLAQWCIAPRRRGSRTSPCGAPRGRRDRQGRRHRSLPEPAPPLEDRRGSDGGAEERPPRRARERDFQALPRNTPRIPGGRSAP
ncbi:MAG: hypothetical protein QM784_19400 [Polyangiaceae bacterium]